jgi:polygalacturonase
MYMFYLADDAVVVKSGYNYYGRLNGRTSENIMVRNINVGFSNGMAIGSETATGARNVTFQDIVLNGSLHAILIKTELGRGGQTNNQ